MAIPLIAAALPSVISGISSLFGKKKAKKEEQKAAAGQSQLVDLFKSQLGQNYFDTGEAKGAMTEIDKNQQNMLNDINATANVNGLTDEARIAMMGKANDATAGAYADLAQSGDLWRQRNLQNYQGALGGLFRIGQTNMANRSQNLQNILGPMQQGIDAANSIGAFDGMSLFGKKKPAASVGTPGAAGAMGGGLAALFQNFKG